MPKRNKLRRLRAMLELACASGRVWGVKYRLECAANWQRIADNYGFAAREEAKHGAPAFKVQELRSEQGYAASIAAEHMQDACNLRARHGALFHLS